ncbi:MAG: hypothetical protein ACOC1K_03410 [Nanoarchaeota archaeon]
MKRFFEPKKNGKIRILPSNSILDLNDNSIKIVSKSYLEKIDKYCPISNMGIKPKRVFIRLKNENY